MIGAYGICAADCLLYRSPLLLAVRRLGLWGSFPMAFLPSRLVKANMSGGFATHEIIGFLPPPGWGAGPSWQTCGPSRCRRGCGAALGAPAPAGAQRPFVQAILAQAISVQIRDPVRQALLAFVVVGISL